MSDNLVANMNIHKYSNNCHSIRQNKKTLAAELDSYSSVISK